MSDSRDPFSITDLGQEMARLRADLDLDTALNPIAALERLGLETPSTPETEEAFHTELQGVEAQFCWNSRGVGIFSGENTEEQAFWAYMVRRFTNEVHSEAEGSRMAADLTLGQVFNPTTLMPGLTQASLQIMRAAGFNSRTAASDLPKAIESIVSQTRISEEDPATFLITAPPIPAHIASLMDFEAAVEAKNPSATALRQQGLLMAREYFRAEPRDANDTVDPTGIRIRNLRGRLEHFIDAIMTEESPEQIPGKLRAIGEQTSRHLALGLEYLYYDKLLRFVDARSGYRIVPENVRVGLIVDKTMYDALLARGLHDPYATIKGYGAETALGSYSTIPRNQDSELTARSQKIDHLQNDVWQEDPLSSALMAALLYADAELPRLPAEDLQS